jgi:hypothetical protein
MPKMYAWSTFNTEVDEWGKAHGKIEPGDEVTAEKLGVTKEEFADLVEVGAVREQEYPDVAEGQSPTEYYREQSAAAMELIMTPTGQVEEAPKVEPEPEPEAKK